MDKADQVWSVRSGLLTNPESRVQFLFNQYYAIKSEAMTD